MLVRPEVFAALHGFDDGYRNGFEDVDLCYRVRERGGRIAYQPESVLYHLESQSPGRKTMDQANATRLRERWGEHWWHVDDDRRRLRDDARRAAAGGRACGVGGRRGGAGGGAASRRAGRARAPRPSDPVAGGPVAAHLGHPGLRGVGRSGARRGFERILARLERPASAFRGRGGGPAGLT